MRIDNRRYFLADSKLAGGIETTGSEPARGELITAAKKFDVTSEIGQVLHDVRTDNGGHIDG